MMDKTYANLWAKTSKIDKTAWHPLILHMLDVAASADAILAREPEVYSHKDGSNAWGWTGKMHVHGSCS